MLMRWADSLDLENGLGQVQRIKCDTLAWVTVKKCRLLDYKEQECIPVLGGLRPGGSPSRGGLCTEGSL